MLMKDTGVSLMINSHNNLLIGRRQCTVEMHSRNEDNIKTIQHLNRLTKKKTLS